MTKIRVVKNPMRSDGSFLVLDEPVIAAKLGAAEQQGFQESQVIARMAVCEFQLPYALAEQTAAEVNAVFDLPEYLSSDEPTLTDQVRKTSAVLRVGANLERAAVLAYLRKLDAEIAGDLEHVLGDLVESISLGRHLS